MMTRSMLWMAALAALVATACSQGNTPPADAGSGDSGSPVDSGSGNDAGGTDAGGGGDAGADAGPVTTLTGTRVIHHVVEGSSSTVDVPADLSKTTITAFVLDAAADGGYDAYAGTGTTSGTYSIPNVPASVTAYLLQFGGSTWIQASQPTLDLSAYAVGRPNGQSPDSGTQLAVSLTGLNAWQRGQDSLAIVSAGAGFVDTLVTVGQDAGPDAGDVTWAATVVYPRDNEVDATQGDTFSMYQLIAADGGVMQTRSAGPFFQSSTFSVADNTVTPLDAGLAAGLATVTTVTFQAGAFDSLRAAMGPSPVATTQVVAINATAVGTGHGIIAPLASLFNATFSPVQTTDQAISATYQFPLNSTAWSTKYGSAAENARISLSLPLPDGGTVTDNENAQIIATDLLSTGVPTAPVVGPPLQVQIDGVAATAPLTLASTTPVVSWTAPGTGTATYYRVLITHLTYTNRLSKFTLTLLTNQTQVRLPPTMLFGGGQHYVANVQAVAMPNANFASTPFQVALPEARGDAFTSLLTTP